MLDQEQHVLFTVDPDQGDLERGLTLKIEWMAPADGGETPDMVRQPLGGESREIDLVEHQAEVLPHDLDGGSFDFCKAGAKHVVAAQDLCEAPLQSKHVQRAGESHCRGAVRSALVAMRP